jgi:hypothetical protein
MEFECYLRGNILQLTECNSEEEQAVIIFERKMFRRISGAKYEDGEWKSRTNRELEELSKGENIVKWIKGQRISWLGHLERMEEDRMPKKTFTQELEGTRRRGRPRKGWTEEVERDLQVLGVRTWRELVIDKKKMERYCWRGESPQRAVAATEQENATVAQTKNFHLELILPLSPKI